VGKLLIWSTREYLKLSPVSSSIFLQPKVTQMFRNISSEESGEQTKHTVE